MWLTAPSACPAHQAASGPIAGRCRARRCAARQRVRSPARRGAAARRWADPARRAVPAGLRRASRDHESRARVGGKEQHAWGPLRDLTRRRTPVVSPRPGSQSMIKTSARRPSRSRASVTASPATAMPCTSRTRLEQPLQTPQTAGYVLEQGHPDDRCGSRRHAIRPAACVDGTHPAQIARSSSSTGSVAVSARPEANDPWSRTPARRSSCTAISRDAAADPRSAARAPRGARVRGRAAAQRRLRARPAMSPSRPTSEPSPRRRPEPASPPRATARWRAVRRRADRGRARDHGRRRARCSRVFVAVRGRVGSSSAVMPFILEGTPRVDHAVAHPSSSDGRARPGG